MKKIISKFMLVGLMSFCMCMLCACSNITIAGNTFVYDSCSTAGYEDMTASQLSNVTSFIPSITSKDTLANYIVTSLGEITFESQKAGTYSETNSNFDYYGLLKSGSKLSKTFWRYMENSEREISFVVFENNAVKGFQYPIYTTNTSDETAPKLTIEIRTGEVEGDKLKLMAHLDYSINNPTPTQQNFNYSMAMYYKVKQ